MQIDIQRDNGIPISKQIYSALADRIASGLLAPHVKLPSIRKLSKALNVSHVTLSQAYKYLEQNGFVELIQGKGTFVKAQVKEILPPLTAEARSNWQDTLIDYLPRAQFAPFHITKTDIHLSSALIDPNLLPNLYFREQIERVFLEQPKLLSLFSDIQGDSALLDAMSHYLETLSIQAPAAEILVTNGLQQGIDLVARTFIGAGDIVIVEDPTYAGAIDIFRGRGATILTVPVDNYGMKIDVLQKICAQVKPKLIFTNPTFHNPTGTVLSLKRRKQLIQLAEAMDCLILEDDPCSEIYFEKKPPVPLKQLDTNGHVIYLKGLSKIYAPSCRIGILTATGSIFKRLLAAKANADLGSPLLTQKVILPLLESNRMLEHTKKLRTALKIRRDLVLTLLNQHAPKDATWIVPTGGLTIWLTISTTLDMNLLLEQAKMEGISFLPGATCYVYPPKTQHIRISYSFVNEDLLRKGISLLCKLIEGNLEIN